jgi:hypothetical protein
VDVVHIADFSRPDIADLPDAAGSAIVDVLPGETFDLRIHPVAKIHRG